MSGMSADQGSTGLQLLESPDPLAAGDAAASAGRWPEAVTAWQSALSTPTRPEAIERLRWFVTWRTSQMDVPATIRRTPSSATRALIASGFCGLIATVSVFLADAAAGSLRTVLVAAAWMLFTAAAVLSIVYAQRTGPFRRSEPRRKGLERLCATASALAEPDLPVPAVVPQQGLERQGSGV